MVVYKGGALTLRRPPRLGLAPLHQSRPVKPFRTSPLRQAGQDHLLGIRASRSAKRHPYLAPRALKAALAAGAVALTAGAAGQKLRGIEGQKVRCQDSRRAEGLTARSHDLQIAQAIQPCGLPPVL
jgi:hypothetical protein